MNEFNDLKLVLYLGYYLVYQLFFFCYLVYGMGLYQKSLITKIYSVLSSNFLIIFLLLYESVFTFK